MQKRLSLLLLLAGLMGCASVSHTFRPIHIDELIFQNETLTPIQNIFLYVEKTREFASCSHVLPGSNFSTRFPAQRYKGNPARVVWEQTGRKYTSKKFVIHPPKGPIPGKPLKVVVIFLEGGRVIPQLTQ